MFCVSSETLNGEHHDWFYCRQYSAGKVFGMQNVRFPFNCLTVNISFPSSRTEDEDEYVIFPQHTAFLHTRQNWLFVRRGQQQP